MTLRLLLIRHGLSSFNCERRIQGRNDLSILTDKGQEQATQTGRVLGSLPINAIYSSPLQRAAETTSKIIKAGGIDLNPVFDEGLLEIDLSSWSGLKLNEVGEKFPQEYETWKNDPSNLVLKRENGQEYKPVEELLSQARIFLSQLLKNHLKGDNQTVLVVGHNAILRCLILILLNDPNKGFKRLKLDNSSLSVFNITKTDTEKYNAQIECLNSTAHLDKPLPKRNGKARLILVRHGETNWNSEGRFQGQIDIPLNSNGKTQALAAGNFLKAFQLDKAYSSSMTRPKETAEEILKFHKGIPLYLIDELIEINHGLWEGKLESEIDTDWPELLQMWKDSPEKVHMPEGESIHDVWSRSIKSWNRICNDLGEGETALVVAHDAVNKTILCHLLGLCASDIWKVKQGNGGVTIIDINQDPLQPDIVTCLNLTAHLGGVLDSTAAGAL